MKKFVVTLFWTLILLVFSFNLKGQTVYFASAPPTSVIEGNAFTLSVKLSSVSPTPVTVNVTTNSATATSSDFISLTTTVTIPAGQISSSNFIVTTTNDAIIEPTENFSIDGVVTSGTTNNTSFSQDLFITDNDTPPTLSIVSGLYPNLILYEYGSYNVGFNLSNVYDSPITINITTSNGTATTSDYQPVSTTLTIVPGQTGVTQLVTAIDDALVEPDEIFTITATVTSGNTTNSSAVMTIVVIDNDTPPTLSLSSLPKTEGETCQVVAQLDRPYNSDVVIQFSTTNGTATTSDYNTTTVTKTFPANTGNPTYVDIPTFNDLIDEPEEAFTVTASVISANTTNSSASINQIIVDNDGFPDLKVIPTVYVGSSLSAEEGKPISFALKLTHPNSTNTNVQVTCSNGTAGSADYNSITTNVTIPAGLTYFDSNALTVPTILDQLQEPDETFSIVATTTSGNTYNTSASNTATILDNYNYNAQNDSFSVIAGFGGSFNVFLNDTFHGLPLNAADVSVTFGSNTMGVTLNSAGIITIPSSIHIGAYSIPYTICENANPSNCDTAIASFTIQTPLYPTFTTTYSDINGDGYVSAGDVINYQISITNNGNAPITNIDYNSVYGIITSGGPIASLGAGQSDNTTFSAVYILTQEDINLGYYINPDNNFTLVFDGTYYGYSAQTDAIATNLYALPTIDGFKLNVFIDTNSNGFQEPDEIDFPFGHFNYEMNNNGTIYHPYTTPFYLYDSNSTNTYNLTYTVDADYASNNSCSVNYSNVSLTQGAGIITYNFPISVNPYDDLSATITNTYIPPMPGFWYDYTITYGNNSNETVLAGTITFTKDNVLSIIDVPNGATLTPSGFTYTFNNLLPYQTQSLSVRVMVPTIPTVALGQLITSSVAINTLPGDILPLNNTSSLTQTIVGSYDPNDKQENHGGRIEHATFTSNDYLTYTIQFENTGTANAINIKVNDVLDAQLDETSIRMVASSHEYSLERIGSSLSWKFSGINLPPSVPNTQTGHGYITFQIKPKPGYAIGDIIPNFAEIYFDFNPAIVTNVCNTEFVATLGYENFAFSNLTYFPNPVKNSLTISNNSFIDSVEITSVLGQQMLSQKVNSLQTEVDLTQLSMGIYFVKVSSQGQEKTIKIVKE
jgi:uncharacterized repeat protein (TIGR01451 family)